MSADGGEVPLLYCCDHMRHLVCYPYSLEGLHRMAADLGIARAWFHASRGHAHYDIPKRRIPEIMGKCRVVTGREVLAIIKGTWVVPGGPQG